MQSFENETDGRIRQRSPECNRMGERAHAVLSSTESETPRSIPGPIKCHFKDPKNMHQRVSEPIWSPPARRAWPCLIFLGPRNCWCQGSQEYEFAGERARMVLSGTESVALSHILGIVGTLRRNYTFRWLCASCYPTPFLSG